MSTADEKPKDLDYNNATPEEWAEYEFATIEYDYKIHPEAAKRIRELFKKLASASRE